MRIKIFIAFILAILISSCKSPQYLPEAHTINVNEYGSYIKIFKGSSKTAGELIAIDETEIVVLTEEAKECVRVAVTDVSYFSLQYAQAEDYGWTIPAFILGTVIHGLLSIYTAPLNLIVTISVNASAKNAFKYNEKDISYEELRMFARFPQGVPPGIDIASIK